MSRHIVLLLVAAGLVVSCAKEPKTRGQATGATGSGSAATDLEKLSQPIATQPASAPPSASAPSPAAVPPPPAPKSGTAGKSSQPKGGPAHQEKAPPAAAYVEVTIPAGTTLHVRLGSALASDKSKAEERVEGSLAAPVVVNGVTALPAGAEVSGVVQSVEKPGRIRGKGKVVLQLTGVRAWSETFAIDARFDAEAGSSNADDVKAGAGGGAAGAIVGAVTGGKKAAVIGGVAGAAAGVLLTRGRDVEIPAGASIAAVVRSAVTLRVPKK